MAEKDRPQEEFSYKDYFVPLTNTKAIYWIILIGLVVYANSLLNGFVWDDITYIIGNSQVHQLNLINAFQNNFFNTQGQYRPLTVIYFSIIYSIFGTAPFIYHIVQVSLHIFCGVLLFLLFRKYFSSALSFFLSLVFLVHPINVESVAYISQSDSPIFLCFGLSALLLLTKKGDSLKRLILIYVFLLLSLFTKETGALFVLMAIIYSFLYRKSKTLYAIIGTFIISVIYFFFRYSIGRVGSSMRPLIPIDNITFAHRILTIPAISFYYLKTLFFPTVLSINQQWIISSVNLSTFYVPLILDLCFLLLLIFIGIYIFKHSRSYLKLFLFFFLWFILGMGLYIQIIPLDATVADRWFYFPIIGFLGMVGVFIKVIKITNGQVKKIGYIAGTIIIFLLSMRTIIRNNDWHDAFTLYSHDIKISDNYDMENMLAGEYLARNQDNEAIIHYKKSINMYPFIFNVYNLANVYQQTGNYPEAEKYYMKIINEKYKIDTFKPVYENLAVVMLLNDSPQKSNTFIQSAIKRYPNDGSLWADQAVSESKLHDRKDALRSAEKAKELMPTEPINNLYIQILNNQPV